MGKKRVYIIVMVVLFFTIFGVINFKSGESKGFNDCVSQVNKTIDLRGWRKNG